MAIEVCSEISSPGFSPRISFSHDLDKTCPVAKEGQRLDSSLLDSSSDFDFCIVNNLKLELSSADELFSNGKILPVQIKRNPIAIATKETHQPDEAVNPPPAQHRSTTRNTTEKKRLKEFLDTNVDADEDEDEKPPTKPFWQFRRSSSLNCDTARGKSLIRSLQFLSRSNSTGSAPNAKQTVAPKETHQKQHLQKQPSISSRRSSASSYSSTYYAYNNSCPQKPSLRKSGSYGNGVRISPVLNLPPPYISKVTKGENYSGGREAVGTVIVHAYQQVTGLGDRSTSSSFNSSVLKLATRLTGLEQQMGWASKLEMEVGTEEREPKDNNRRTRSQGQVAESKQLFWIGPWFLPIFKCKCHKNNRSSSPRHKTHESKYKSNNESSFPISGIEKVQQRPE
ncbi:PREDICTED: At1g67050 [Prunus dulcis]|uniref:PREDICTED: At1g67050 n=1 Tax=Prunus dulcis TaxID=3755 RepID=A0A5E4EQK6_PRUDU|nr:PREDICTED: At1g67050 [Prunus dulcis]